MPNEKFSPESLKLLSTQLAETALELAEQNSFVARVLCKTAISVIVEKENSLGIANTFRSFVRPGEGDRAKISTRPERTVNLPEPTKQDGERSVGVLDSRDATTSRKLGGKRNTTKTPKLNNRTRGKKDKV